MAFGFGSQQLGLVTVAGDTSNNYQYQNESSFIDSRQYSPTSIYAPTLNLNSGGASGAYITKKDVQSATNTPSQSANATDSTSKPSVSLFSGGTGGLLALGAIIAVGAVAYVVIKG